MASIFSKDPKDQPPPSPYGKELIEKEIEHLRKPKSTRQSPGERANTAILFSTLTICVVAALYVWDPFFFAWKKDDAIRAYLYLHNYDNAKNTQALADCGIFSEVELHVLDNEKGPYQDYFSTPELAEQKAQDIEDYMKGLNNLHEGNWDQMDTLSKIRWVLFYRVIPIGTPTQWGILSPQVTE